MSKTKEFKNVMREMMKTNYTSIDFNKTCIIFDYLCGKGRLEKNGEIVVYKYKDYTIECEDFGGDDVKICVMDENCLYIDEDDYPEFIKYIKNKNSQNMLNKCRTSHIIGDSTVLFSFDNTDRIKDDIRTFYAWASSTHLFLMTRITDSNCLKKFIEYDINILSVLGYAYSCAAKQYTYECLSSWKHLNLTFYYRVPDEKCYREILYKIIDRREWDIPNYAEQWKKELQGLL